MAVVVVSLVSLIGVLTVPVAGKKIMRYLSAFLVAMGISALASDAVLHLIPHVSTPHSMYTCRYGFPSSQCIITDTPVAAVCVL